MHFERGGFYRISQDPDSLFTLGAAQHAGELVQLVTFENLHGYGHKAGARVRLRGEVFWIALDDLCGDNVVWDTYCGLIEGMNVVWLAGAVQHGSPFEFAWNAACCLLQAAHGLSAQQAPVWAGAVVEVM